MSVISTATSCLALSHATVPASSGNGFIRENLNLRVLRYIFKKTCKEKNQNIKIYISKKSTHLLRAMPVKGPYFIV